ncbi:MAG: hypothetical protein ACI8TL_001238 [Natronomonas sp.]|jgi:hypothetical protein
MLNIQSTTAAITESASDETLELSLNGPRKILHESGVENVDTIAMAPVTAPSTCNGFRARGPPPIVIPC